tara:strand:- start:12492 stop:13151 length:660 start_codon:yes stop_codon:yes gene_type:complete
MKFYNILFILFSIVNCDLEHEHSGYHSIGDGHSYEHSYSISHSDTGFNILYVGNSVVKDYQIFTNFENEIENRFVLTNENYDYIINNYANNIEVHDSIDHRLECLYYSKVVNNLNYTILKYENVSFHSALVHINSDYSYCLKRDINEDDYNVLLYPILVVCLCVLVIVLIIVSISCGIMRHRAIAHVHTFTRRPDTTTREIEVPELENGEIQTIQHVHT